MALETSNTWRQKSRTKFLVVGGDFEPGKYKTACGKGYGEFSCPHGEPDFLDLSAAAIDFFQVESSDSIFYWERITKTFQEVLIGD